MTAASSDKDASASKSKSQKPDGDAASALAQAYKDIARGEQHASALEANLTNLESKLDALLASIEGNHSLPAADASHSQDKKASQKKDPEAKE